MLSEIILKSTFISINVIIENLFFLFLLIQIKILQGKTDPTDSSFKKEERGIKFCRMICYLKFAYDTKIILQPMILLWT